MKWITGPQGLWFISWKMFRAEGIGSTVPIQLISYQVWAAMKSQIFSAWRMPVADRSSNKSRAKQWIYKWLCSWNWPSEVERVGGKTSSRDYQSIKLWILYYYYHCMSTKLCSMFHAQCRFDQTCYSQAFKQTLWPNQSPTTLSPAPSRPNSIPNRAPFSFPLSPLKSPVIRSRLKVDYSTPSLSHTTPFPMRPSWIPKASSSLSASGDQAISPPLFKRGAQCVRQSSV